MPSFNRLIIAGHLGRDPELRHMPSGTPVCVFSVATTEKWTDKSSNEKRDRTTWVDCEAFARAAEVLNQYLSKGSAVLLEGKLRQDQWEDRDGNKRSKLKLVIENFQFLGDPRGSASRQDDPVPQGGSGIDEDDVPF